jgi:hypothetical protein
VSGVEVVVEVAGVASACALRRTAVPAARAALLLRKVRRVGLDIGESFDGLLVGRATKVEKSFSQKCVRGLS